MNKYLIGYIEDNDLGVYNKEIIVEAETFTECSKQYIKKYPTLHAVKQLFGEIEERWLKYYTHESQDTLRRSQLDLEKLIK